MEDRCFLLVGFSFGAALVMAVLVLRQGFVQLSGFVSNALLAVLVGNKVLSLFKITASFLPLVTLC